MGRLICKMVNRPFFFVLCASVKLIIRKMGGSFRNLYKRDGKSLGYRLFNQEKVVPLHPDSETIY